MTPAVLPRQPLSPSRQQVLPLPWAAEPTLEDFVLDAAGANAAALHALRQLLAAPEHDTLYLWGEGGTGKTHLLRAAGHTLQSCGRCAVLLGPESPPARWPDPVDVAALPAGTLLALDDVHAFSRWQQELAFALFNAARAHGLPLLAAGNAAPAALPLLPDLRSRLAWGLALRLAAPDDALRTAVLQRQAERRGYVLSPELLHYLLTHLSRDPRRLAKVMAALDRYALATKRAATVPLLKALLAEQPELLHPDSAPTDPADLPS